MAPEPVIVLWLELCLSTGIQAAAFAPPAPIISMEPGSVRPLGGEVTISCYTPVRADYFRLIAIYQDDFGNVGEEYPAIYPGNECHLYHPAVRMEHAARYHCFYRSGNLWSEPSIHLDLIVTGIYPSPNIYFTNPVVKPGDSVEFFCNSETPASVYILLKGVPAVKNFVMERRGNSLNFTVFNVREKDSGDYRCYYYNITVMQLWSGSSTVVPVFVGIEGNTIGGSKIIKENASLPSRCSHQIHLSPMLLALLTLPN